MKKRIMDNLEANVLFHFAKTTKQMERAIRIKRVANGLPACPSWCDCKLCKKSFKSSEQHLQSLK